MKTHACVVGSYSVCQYQSYVSRERAQKSSPWKNTNKNRHKVPLAIVDSGEYTLYCKL